MTIRKKKISNPNIRPHRILKPWASLTVGGKIWRTIGVALCALWVGTFFQVLLFKFVEPPFTPYMLACYNEQRKDPNLSEQYYRICVPIEDISPNMLKAAILGEDGRFLYHHGFSFKGLREAYLKNEVEGHIVRGGSSISQQTAKNCFLPFNRNLFRKLVEAHYTFLIEKLWGKKRILECYLNVVEFGNGIYGCEAASWYYYNHSAKTLTQEEAVRLASMLPNPKKVTPHCLTETFVGRTQWILKWFERLSPNVWDGFNETYVERETAYANRGLFYFAGWVALHELKKLRPHHDNQDLENNTSYDEKEEDSEKEPSQNYRAQTMEAAQLSAQGVAGAVGECAGPVGLHHFPGVVLCGI